MTKMKRAGTTVFAEANEISRYKKSGFVIVEEAEAVVVTGAEEKKKTFSRLKVDELKALAEMLNVDIEGMNGTEIKAAIEATETDSETLQTLIDALD